MPNIIEQQDLLKGLTDQSLAALLQNPTGQVPPFLVAAEAQRRQAIRQQFAGQGPQESVVDSLSKQLAGVPENIQQTGGQQGIASIPQQGAQQPEQPEQQMRNGGYVRRFDDGGYVDPMGGYSGLDMPSEFPSLDVSPLGRFFTQTVPGAVAGVLRYPVPEWQRKMQNPEEPPAMTPEEQQQDIAAQLRYAQMKRVPTASPTPTIPQNPDTGKEDTSDENKTATADDEIRKRIEALYGEGAPSNWDDAQKWFAMAQQFLKPDTTTFESALGAAQIYAQGRAEEDKARQDAARERELALLKYDIGERDAMQQTAARKAEYAMGLEKEKRDRAFEMQKLGFPSASTAIASIDSALDNLYKQLLQVDQPSELGSMVDPSQAAQIKSTIQAKINALENQRATLLSRGGYNMSVTPEELNQ